MAGLTGTISPSDTRHTTRNEPLYEHADPADRADQQPRIGRIADIGLDHRCIDPYPGHIQTPDLSCDTEQTTVQRLDEPPGRNAP